MKKIKSGIKKRIHVNQHNIRWNSKNENQKPVVTVKTSKGNFKGFHVQIFGESEVIYQPEKPLSCGAKMWIETTAELLIT